MSTRSGQPEVDEQGRPATRRASRLAPLAAAGLLAAGSLLVAACGSDGASASNGETTTTTTAGETTTDGGSLAEVDQTVEAVLTSAETKLFEAGADGEIVYGWNHLVGDGTGTGSLGDGPVGVDMLGNVDYHEGGGEFFGFITFDFGDGNTLAVRMDGQAKAATATSDATFQADLEVIGGTGALVDATGRGLFEGSRPAQLGGAVDGTYSFDLGS